MPYRRHNRVINVTRDGRILINGKYVGELLGQYGVYLEDKGFISGSEELFFRIGGGGYDRKRGITIETWDIEGKASNKQKAIVKTLVGMGKI